MLPGQVFRETLQQLLCRRRYIHIKETSNAHIIEVGRKVPRRVFYIDQHDISYHTVINKLFANNMSDSGSGACNDRHRDIIERTNEG